MQPFVVRGESFAPRERVRLTAFTAAEERLRAVATRAGTFTATFAAVTATRCDLIRVVAIGAKGSRAILKYLPSPACLAE